MKCGALVEAESDVEKLKLPGAAGIALGALVGFLGGFLGSLAVLFALAAVGSVVMALTLQHRCQDCSHAVSERSLLDGERNEVRDKRAQSFMRAGLFGLGSLVAAWFWITAVMVSAGSKAPAAATDNGTLGASSGVQAEVDALERAGDVEALAAKFRDPFARETARPALERLGSKSVPFLLPILDDADEYTKRATLLTLAQIEPRTERALDALIAFVQREKVPHLRARAIDILGKAEGAARRAVPALEPLLADYNLAGTAERALSKIDPSTDWAARRAALHAK